MLKSNAKTQPDKSTVPSVPATPDQKGCTPSFLTDQKNEIGQVCKPTQPAPKEQYVQPDEEKDTGGEA